MSISFAWKAFMTESDVAFSSLNRSILLQWVWLSFHFIFSFFIFVPFTRCWATIYLPIQEPHICVCVHWITCKQKGCTKINENFVSIFVIISFFRWWAKEGGNKRFASMKISIFVFIALVNVKWRHFDNRFWVRL